MSDEKQGLDRRRFITATAAGLALGTVAAKEVEGQSAAKSRRPNVIVYIADQFRADFIGANGQNYTTKTPNLDAMATRGTYFSGAICNQPVCSPSRSVLMTGRYATETGVWHNATNMDPSLPTLAGEFRNA
jgi:arylsulfatase A-like enzyme